MPPQKKWLSQSTYQTQRDLADYCLTGEAQNEKHEGNHRLTHYRRLVFNACFDMIQNACPLTEELLGEDDFLALGRRFHRNHACQPPQVWKVTRELFEYVSESPHEEELRKKYPFIDELIYFEWVEIEMYMMEDKSLPVSSPKGHWEKNNIILHPEHQILSLSYPVHDTHPNKISEEQKGTYFVFAYRSPEDLDVHFKQISPLFVLAIQRSSEGQTLTQVSDEAVQLFQLDEKEQPTILTELVSFFKHLRKQKMVLGFKV